MRAYIVSIQYVSEIALEWQIRTSLSHCPGEAFKSQLGDIIPLKWTEMCTSSTGMHNFRRGEAFKAIFQWDFRWGGSTKALRQGVSDTLNKEQSEQSKA